MDSYSGSSVGRRRWHALGLCAVLLGANPVLALAQGKSQTSRPAAAAQPEAAGDPYDTIAQELLDALVERRVLSKDEAQSLIAKIRAKVAERAAQRTNASGVSTEAEARGQVRVIYLPETEKNRIREEIRKEVLAQAKEENWAQPNALPEWIKRISVSGDLRARFEFDGYGRGNCPCVFNFQAMNSGPPVDINSANFSYLNATEDRRQLRLRARLGLDAAVTEELQAHLRFATGNITNPVSTNQTFGSDFNKYNFLLDRAYLDYQPVGDVSMRLGRMANPWLAPTELVWDVDLNFDGFAARYALPLEGGTPFITAGAFAVENTLLDFPANKSQKFHSRDKWLYGSQLGMNWVIGGVHGDVGMAYYYYDQLQGQPSSSCQNTTASEPCDTDLTRAGSVQKGNTLFALRTPAAGNPPNSPNFQYFGLAAPFRELSASFRFDVPQSDALHWVLEADAVRNLAYDKQKVLKLIPVNNYGTDNVYQGGDKGFLVQALVGRPQIGNSGDWNIIGGFRRVETDAVVDAFTDSDFHLGGTNAKGYHVGGSLGFAKNAWLTGRWLSATEVTGAPFALDVYQIEVNARF